MNGTDSFHNRIPNFNEIFFYTEICINDKLRLSCDIMLSHKREREKQMCDGQGGKMGRN